MIRLLPIATLMLATVTIAPACAYEQPYQQGWGPAPAQVWYQRPAPPPQRWGWQAPAPRWGWQQPQPRWGWQAPPARWAGPPPSRGWGGPPPRDDRGWGAPRPTRFEQRRHDDHGDRRRDDRRW